LAAQQDPVGLIRSLENNQWGQTRLILC
jgi:hypothetical protein